MNEQIIKKLQEWKTFEEENKVIAPQILAQIEQAQQKPLNLLWVGQNEESGRLLDAFLNIQFFKNYGHELNGVHFQFVYKESITYEATFTNGPNQILDDITLERIFFAKESVWQVLRGQVQKITVGVPNEMLNWLNVKYSPTEQLAKLSSKEVNSWIICFTNNQEKPGQPIVQNLLQNAQLQLILNNVNELLSLKQALQNDELAKKHVFEIALQKLNYHVLPVMEKLNVALNKRLKKLQSEGALKAEITYLLNAERALTYIASLNNIKLQNFLQVLTVLNDLDQLQHLMDDSHITDEMAQLKAYFEKNVQQAVAAYETKYHQFQSSVKSFDEAQAQFNNAMKSTAVGHITKVQYKNIIFTNHLYNQQASQICSTLDVLSAQKVDAATTLESFEKKLNEILHMAYDKIFSKLQVIQSDKSVQVKQLVFGKQLALKQSLRYLAEINENCNVKDEWINEKLVAVEAMMGNVEQIVPLYEEQTQKSFNEVKVKFPLLQGKLPNKPEEIKLDKSALKIAIQSNAKIWTVSIILAALYLGGNILYFSFFSISNVFSKEDELETSEVEKVNEDGISEQQLINFSKMALQDYLKLIEYRSFEQMESYLSEDSLIYEEMKEKANAKGRREQASYLVDQFENISIRKKSTYEAYTVISKVVIKRSAFSNGRKTYAEYYLYTVVDTENPDDFKLQLFQLEEELLD